MISRSSVIFCRITHIGFVLSLLAYRLTDPDNGARDFWLLIGMVLLVFSAVAEHQAPPLPLLQKRGLHPKLSNPNAGYCRHCGKLVEYSE